MPIRKEPLLPKYIYHIFNKTIDDKQVFKGNDYSLAFYQRLIYYRSTKSVLSFSKLKELSDENLLKLELQTSLKKDFRVEVLNYSLMPNHFHLLLMQLTDTGITEYMSQTINSFTRYYNVKNDRKGQVFLHDFKAVMIKTDEQLIHTSRYIDLNSYSSGLARDANKLEQYKWSGYKAYINGEFKDPLINTKPILKMFDDDREKYKEFVLDRADYQKSLEIIKHTLNY